MSAPTYSVIVPVLNEAKEMVPCLENIRNCLPESEIIVVDGGSADGTAELAREWGARVVTHASTRGGQCHAGAEVAQGEVFIFLHADCRLEPDASRILEAEFLRKRRVVAKFSAQFNSPALGYRLRSRLGRMESIFTSFGDQGIVVSAASYRAGNRIPDMRLFEDVEFFRRARKRGKVIVLNATINLSTRRFDLKGNFRCFVKDGLLIFYYLLGMSHEKLYSLYYRKPASISSKQ